MFACDIKVGLRTSLLPSEAIEELEKIQKIPPCNAGDTVCVKIPDVHRGRGD